MLTEFSGKPFFYAGSYVRGLPSFHRNHKITDLFCKQQNQKTFIHSSSDSKIKAKSFYSQKIEEFSQPNQKPRMVHSDHLSYQVLSQKEMEIEKQGDEFIIPSLGLKCKFRGIELESKNRPRYLWRAKDAVTDQEVKEIFDHLVKKYQTVHINTGTHGNEAGENVHDTQKTKYAHSGFLEHDILLSFVHENVSFHIVSTNSPEIRPKEANHIKIAWCYSASKTAREVKELAEKEVFVQINNSGNVGTIIGNISGNSTSFSTNMDSVNYKYNKSNDQKE